ncbi:apolipoprotein N-acyltransferase [Aureliella helgolandensis]|nr:apolipoprotein N-acyltransferase [Aureliella helgolandensis]
MARKPRTKRATPSEKPAAATGQPASDWRSVLWPSLASAVALWAAFPPVGLSLLAWLAPMGWLVVADRKPPISRRGYTALWLSGCLFWLATLQGIRLAYWPLYFGWLALSLYLACYIPLFVGMTRLLRQQLRLPLLLAAPTSWVGLELFRSLFMTGFAVNLLAHTEARHPLTIQITDQIGVYGLSWIMMAVAVAAYQLAVYLLDRQRLRKRLANRESTLSQATAQRPFPVAALGLASGLVMTTLAYGGWRLRQADQLAQSPPLLNVLLVQENTPTQFDADRSMYRQAWNRYLELTRKLANEHRSTGVEIALVVWPESTFTGGDTPWISPNLPQELPEAMAQGAPELVLRQIEAIQEAFFTKIGMVLAAARGQTFRLRPDEATRQQSPHLLVGGDAIVINDQEQRDYNAAIFIGPDGRVLGHYAKMQLVMFGEYIPWGAAMEWLRQLYPLRTQPGEDARSFQIGEVRFAPNICFESTLPQLVAWQIGTLRARGEAPDVLINVTNDSWFRGSSILDHHLACSTLIAVENHLPMLVAANTGISAHIDGSGRILQATDRLVADGILASPRRDGRWGLVQAAGQLVGWICLIFVGVALVPPCWRALTRRFASQFPNSPVQIRR